MTIRPTWRGRLQRTLRRLARSDEAAAVGAEAAAGADAGPYAAARVRDTVELQGAIVSLTGEAAEPGGDTPVGLEAELSDGTGSVTLVWMGRRAIPGIEVGRSMVVHGTLAVHRGRRVIFNPRYELLP